MPERTIIAPVRAGSDLNELVLAVARKRSRYHFSLLFNYFAPRLKSYLMRLGVDAGLAEELVQDVMLRV